MFGAKAIKGRTEPYEITVLGEPASKSNSRRAVTIHGRPAFIKSKKAMVYSSGFRDQVPFLDELFLERLHMDIDIFYCNERSDIDETLILDLLQDRVYLNDRQVRSRRARWNVDKYNPRSIIRLRLMTDEDYAGAEVPVHG